MPPQVIAIQVAALPTNVAVVPGRRVTDAHRNRMIVDSPIGDAVVPRVTDSIAVNQIVTDVFTALVRRPAVPHHVPCPAVYMHTGKNIPQAGYFVAVNGLAGIGHYPFGIPVLTQLPSIRIGAPLSLRRVVQHTRPTIGFVIAMCLDPEQIDIVGITAIVTTLVRIADISFPTIRVRPIEGTRMSCRSQFLIDAVAPVERVRQIAGSADAGRACMIEIAYAFYTESCHSILLAMNHENLGCAHRFGHCGHSQYCLSPRTPLSFDAVVLVPLYE